MQNILEVKYIWRSNDLYFQLQVVFTLVSDFASLNLNIFLCNSKITIVNNHLRRLLWGLKDDEIWGQSLFRYLVLLLCLLQIGLRQDWYVFFEPLKGIWEEKGNQHKALMDCRLSYCSRWVGFWVMWRLRTVAEGCSQIWRGPGSYSWIRTVRQRSFVTIMRQGESTGAERRKGDMATGMLTLSLWEM